MYRVIYGDHGTGKRARVAGIEMAGKSGTAQGPRADDDAWFVAFAPYENPEIAVAVVVEGGGGGGSTAAPVAQAVIKAYFDDQARKQSVATATDAESGS
jgi:cell division protein FtsI/penicillin-binding protein 2